MNLTPEFFIIAGPNGAGKSTNGDIFVLRNLTIFNGDLIYEDLIKQHPNINPERLQGGVAFALEQARNKALASRSNFAFETNYSSDMASEISQHFREAGYKTTLVYFGLDNIEISTSRVQERYELGGHDVSAVTIKSNFEEGIKRVNNDLHLFDQAFFVDTIMQDIRIVAFVDKSSKQYHRIVAKVDWYKANFENTVNGLDFTSKQAKRLKIRHHLH